MKTNSRKTILLAAVVLVGCMFVSFAASDASAGWGGVSISMRPSRGLSIGFGSNGHGGYGHGGYGYGSYGHGSYGHRVYTPRVYGYRVCRHGVYGYRGCGCGYYY